MKMTKWLSLVLLMVTTLITGAKAQYSVGLPENKLIHVISQANHYTWKEIFEKSGYKWIRPQIIAYKEQAVQSNCSRNGVISAMNGPFYCPNDMAIYYNPFVWTLMSRNLGSSKAANDAAVYFVLSHEVAHHVQYLLGYMNRRIHPAKLELQADCLAGVQFNHANGKYITLEAGDIEEAIEAAAIVGDDHIARRNGHALTAENYSHGTSKQRVNAFLSGFESGSPKACEF